MSRGARFSRYEQKLASPTQNWQTRWLARSGLIFSLEDSAARVGNGEAAPLPGYSDDSLAEAEAALAAVVAHGTAALFECVERAIVDPRRLLSDLRALEIATPSARSAVECAVFDLVGQGRGEPMHRVLRACTPSLSAPITTLRCAALVELDPDAGAAQAALAAGFGTLKVKVGGPESFDEELVRLTRLRQLLGPRVALRLDANRAWSSADARARLAALRPLGLEFIEEPVAAAGPPLNAPPVPIALDESLRQPRNFDSRSLRDEGVVAFVIKPTVLGGITRSLDWIELAQKLGLATVISHTFEGWIGYRALVELALAWASPTRPTASLATRHCQARMGRGARQ